MSEPLCSTGFIQTYLVSSLWERMKNFGNLSVVVNDGNPLRAGFSPSENDPPLIVNANGMISRQAPSEGLQTVTWRNGQVGEYASLIHLYQFSQGDAAQSR